MSKEPAWSASDRRAKRQTHGLTTPICLDAFFRCTAYMIFVTAQVGDLVQDRRRFAKDVGSPVRASMMARQARRKSRCILRAQSSSIFDESLQLAQVIGIAQVVQHAWHRVIGLPVMEVTVDAGDISPKGCRAWRRRNGGRSAVEATCSHRVVADSESRSRPCA